MKTIQQQIDELSLEERARLSDGYHSFGQLYDHRNALYIAFLKQKSQRFFEQGHGENPWRSKKHSDGTPLEDWFLLGLGTNKGNQITYHLPIKDWDKCDYAETLDKAPEWDNHSSEDVLERLEKI